MNNALRLLSTLWLLILFFGSSQPAAAQEEEPVPTGAILLRAPQVSDFPTIRLYIDAYDAQGNYLPGLKPANVQVIEDGRTLPSTRVEEVPNSLQVILVWNAGTTLGVQADGLTEMERIRQALQTWAEAQPEAGQDLFNLVKPDGMTVVAEDDPQALVEALAELPPELATGQPTLTSLADSLDLATDALDDPLMKRVILFVTPPLTGSDTEHLEELAGRARDARTPVHVWQVGPAVDPGIVQPLEQFALATGGMFFPISPVDALPEIEPLFSRIRRIYQVEYVSGIRADGDHRLSVQAVVDGSILVSNELTFPLEIRPPNPIFLEPPAVVQRNWNTAEGTALDPILEPNQVELQILLEFPDQHQRSLVSTRLYVDGGIVAENTSEPFDRFLWDISAETVTTQHMLRVEAVDAIGMTGTSAEIPVDIVIEQPAQNNLSDRFSSQGIIAIGAVVLSGAALAAVLVLSSTQRRGRWKRRRPDKKWLNDPLTQPIAVPPLPARKNKTRPINDVLKAEALAVPKARPANGIAPARLVVLDENEQPITGGAIPLSRQEITFGCDPQRATQVLNTSTVDGLHARLHRTEEGGFVLADNNSIAGTWINYSPVTEKGAILRHGDLVHIGRVMFRFEMADPTLAPAGQILVSEVERLP